MLIGFLFILLFVLTSGGQMCLNKIYQKNVESTLVSHFLFLLIMSFFAAISFFVLAGFNISIDSTSLLYAFISCLIIAATQILTLVCMANVNLTMVTVSANAGGLLWPTLFGVIFLNEKISVTTIIGIVFILLAFMVPFLFNIKIIMHSKTTKIGYIACLALFLLNGHSNSINKVFTASGTATSNSSYLTWINILMFPIVLACFLLLVKKSKQPIKELPKQINFKYYWYVIAGTVIGCVGMLFSFEALSRLDVSLYSPLYSSIYIIFLTLISKFIFKEELKKENYISVALALVSVIFCAI